MKLISLTFQNGLIFDFPLLYDETYDYICTFIYIYPMYDCECSGLYQEEDPMAMRRNELELTLEPVYNCNLGCFAA